MIKALEAFEYHYLLFLKRTQSCPPQSGSSEQFEHAVTSGGVDRDDVEWSLHDYRLPAMNDRAIEHLKPLRARVPREVLKMPAILL